MVDLKNVMTPEEYKEFMEFIDYNKKMFEERLNALKSRSIGGGSEYFMRDVKIKEEISEMDISMLILRRNRELTSEMERRYEEVRQPYVARRLAPFMFPFSKEIDETVEMIVNEMEAMSGERR